MGLSGVDQLWILPEWRGSQWPALAKRFQVKITSIVCILANSDGDSLKEPQLRWRIGRFVPSRLQRAEFFQRYGGRDVNSSGSSEQHERRLA
jgi:hypothetical protein